MAIVQNMNVYVAMSERKKGWHKLNYHERGERIEELKQRLEAVDGVIHEMGEDTRLGNSAIGAGVSVVADYLGRMEAALEKGDG